MSYHSRKKVRRKARKEKKRMGKSISEFKLSQKKEYENRQLLNSALIDKRPEPRAKRENKNLVTKFKDLFKRKIKSKT